MACRLGGDYITSDLVPLSTGIDMLANLVRLSLGIPIERKKTITKISCVQFLNPDNYERCKQFVDSKDTHIIRSEIREYSTHRIENSLDRLGFIIMQTDNYDQIDNILKKIK